MSRYILSFQANIDLDDITYYEPTENGIFIVRILSQRQDFEKHL